MWKKLPHKNANKCVGAQPNSKCNFKLQQVEGQIKRESEGRQGKATCVCTQGGRRGQVRQIAAAAGVENKRKLKQQRQWQRAVGHRESSYQERGAQRSKARAVGRRREGHSIASDLDDCARNMKLSKIHELHLHFACHAPFVANVTIAATVTVTQSQSQSQLHSCPIVPPQLPCCHP